MWGTRAVENTRGYAGLGPGAGAGGLRHHHRSGVVGAGMEPGVVEDAVQGDPILRPNPETRPDQILTLGADGSSEAELCVADLLVLLEGDVAADHVVEEDAQGPHGQRVAVIAAAANPLRRRVHPGACKRNI